MSRPRGRSDPQLDSDRPDRTAGDEPLEPQGGVGAAALAERGGARAVRVDSSRGEGVGVGARAVRDIGHVRGVRGRGATGEGGELAGGGHGWNAFEREEGFGNFAEGVGGQKGKKEEQERRGGKKEIRRVFSEEEGKEREEAEDRRDIRYFVCGFWGIGVFRLLVIYSMQIKLKFFFFFFSCYFLSAV